MSDYKLAFRASNLLKLHAVLVFLSMIAIGIVTAIYLLPAFNTISLASVPPAERVDYLARTLANYRLYYSLVSGVFLILSGAALGAALYLSLKWLESRAAVLGLAAGLLAIIYGALAAAMGALIYEPVYAALKAALSKPSVAKYLAAGAMNLEAARRVVEAIQSALARLKPIRVLETLAYIQLAAGVLYAVLAAAAALALASRLRTKSAWAFAAVLLVSAIAGTLAAVGLDAAGLGIVVGVASVAEPVLAWLVARVIRSRAEEEQLRRLEEEALRSTP